MSTSFITYAKDIAPARRWNLRGTRYERPRRVLDMRNSRLRAADIWIAEMKKPRILEEQWQCNECGEIHDDDDSARYCCPPQITAGYACPICKDFYQREEVALDCCGYDPEAPPPPSAAELEAAGQMRLPI